MVSMWRGRGVVVSTRRLAGVVAVPSRRDGFDAMPHRLDAVDAAARESAHLARESRQCRDGVAPRRARAARQLYEATRT